MLQFFAALFFLIALFAPLALIALTVQQSGRAILAALNGEIEPDRRNPATRLRISPAAPTARPTRVPLRAAA